MIVFVLYRSSSRELATFVQKTYEPAGKRRGIPNRLGQAEVTTGCPLDRIEGATRASTKIRANVSSRQYGNRCSLMFKTNMG